MKNRIKVLLSALLATGLLPGIALAELRLASPFTDAAVLQRDALVPVWGTADAGAEITVEFAGQTKTVLTDSQGKWQVELDPLSASFDPRDLMVRSSVAGQSASIDNVLVGEVWICSGQSNMQFAVNSVPEIKALAPKAKNIRTFEVKRAVAFEEQDRCEGQWLEEIPSSAVAFSFAYFLEEAGDVPVGILLTCWGSSSIEAWMPRDMTDTVPHFKTMMEEFDADSVTRRKIQAILKGPKKWSKQNDVFLRRQSNILYNAMMHPLAPYACRGLVWYQGERNTMSMHGMPKEPWYARNSGMLKYGDTLKEWIKRYRKEWGNDNMHFLIVQLPGYYNPKESWPDFGVAHPASHSWAWMRESQLKALELPHTSVATTIDLGDAKNVHPKDKLPVGQRLALLAARDTLGQAIEAQGPVMQNVELNGDHLIVHFDHSEGLQTNDGQAPTGFWLADDSNDWKKAEAVLKGQTVELRCAELSKPLYVRYAFAGKPNVNLVNEAELPAYPFRTDPFKP